MLASCWINRQFKICISICIFLLLFLLCFVCRSYSYVHSNLKQMNVRTSIFGVKKLDTRRREKNTISLSACSNNKNQKRYKKSIFEQSVAHGKWHIIALFFIQEIHTFILDDNGKNALIFYKICKNVIHTFTVKYIYA